MALPTSIRLVPTGDPQSETIACDRCGFRLTLEGGVSAVWPDDCASFDYAADEREEDD